MAANEGPANLHAASPASSWQASSAGRGGRGTGRRGTGRREAAAGGPAAAPAAQPPPCRHRRPGARLQCLPAFRAMPTCPPQTCSRLVARAPLPGRLDPPRLVPPLHPPTPRAAHALPPRVQFDEQQAFEFESQASVSKFHTLITGADAAVRTELGRARQVANRAQQVEQAAAKARRKAAEAAARKAAAALAARAALLSKLGLAAACAAGEAAYRVQA